MSPDHLLAGLCLGTRLAMVSAIMTELRPFMLVSCSDPTTEWRGIVTRRGSGVLSNISCQMGWDLLQKERILHSRLELSAGWMYTDYGFQKFEKAANSLGTAENTPKGKSFFSISNLVQNMIAYVIQIWVYILKSYSSSQIRDRNPVAQNTRPSFYMCDWVWARGQGEGLMVLGTFPHSIKNS